MPYPAVFCVGLNNDPASGHVYLYSKSDIFDGIVCASSGITSRQLGAANDNPVPEYVVLTACHEESMPRLKHGGIRLHVSSHIPDR